jgi:hypothetical protein
MNARSLKETTISDTEKQNSAKWFHEDKFPWDATKFSRKLYFSHRDFRKQRETDHMNHMRRASQAGNRMKVFTGHGYSLHSST